MYVKGSVVSVREEDGLAVVLQNPVGNFHITVPKEHRQRFGKVQAGDELILELDGAQVPAIIRKKNGKEHTAVTYGPSTAVHVVPHETIVNLKRSTYSSVYAVITGVRPLMPTQGTDLLFTLNITDETGETVLRVFISDVQDLQKFVASATPLDLALDYTCQENFSKIFRAGDILLIRNIKLGANGKFALMHKSCSLSVLANAQDLSGSGAHLKTASQTKLGPAVHHLAEFYASHCNSTVHSHSPRPGSQRSKDKTIAELEPGAYADVVGKVVYIEQGYAINICITDFTLNKRVANRKKGKFETGMLLYVMIYGRHMADARDVQVGNICRFENLKIKEAGRHLSSHMSESKDGCIQIVRDERAIAQITERERAYYARKNQRASGSIYMVHEKDDAERELSEPFRINFPPSLNQSAINVTTNDTGIPIAFTKIRNISGPGAYFIKCRIESFALDSSPAGPCLQLQLCDTEDSIRVLARQKLTRLLLHSPLLVKRIMFKCMVLCTSIEPGTYFMVNTLVEDDEITDLIVA
ncbi:hypothetical protein PAPHI01_0424 [Pancytospora philotis]|nr:hypothetical protein PAPHI01_0424 [Pancytospora philotis]